MQSRLGRTSVAAVIAVAGVVASACGDDPADPTSMFDAGTGGSGNGADGSVESSVLGGGEDDASFGNLDDARPDPTDLQDGAACASQSQEVELAPLDMLIALDTSFSMDFDEKWPNVSNAITSFTKNATFDGLGVALQYFPIRAQCSVSGYQTPAVPFDTLPNVGIPIRTSLSKQQMSGGTPMVPVLQGTLTYAASYQQAHPDHRVVVVLATDGIPDDSCQVPPPGGLANTISNAVSVVGQAQSGTGMKTFVIGVGDELTALNAIAQAGGTGTAVLVSTSSNVEKQFSDALNSIRKTSLACDYAIPPPSDGKPLDLERVNVRFTVGATSTTFLYVANQGQCGREPGKGWYYDDPANPKRVVLCPDVCDAVRAQPNAKVDVLFGCKRLAAR
ncbi:MAG: vWA domain-containing protein [Polyangiaceae bacterium]